MTSCNRRVMAALVEVACRVRTEVRSPLTLAAQQDTVTEVVGMVTLGPVLELEPTGFSGVGVLCERRSRSSWKEVVSLTRCRAWGFTPHSRCGGQHCDLSSHAPHFLGRPASSCCPVTSV